MTEKPAFREGQLAAFDAPLSDAITFLNDLFKKYPQLQLSTLAIQGPSHIVRAAEDLWAKRFMFHEILPLTTQPTLSADCVARKKVFAVSDLMHLIFSMIDGAQLLPLKSVSHRWYNLITSTPVHFALKVTKDDLASVAKAFPRLRAFSCDLDQASAIRGLTQLEYLKCERLPDNETYVFPHLTRLDISLSSGADITGKQWNYQCLSALTSLRCLDVRNSGFGTITPHNLSVLTLLPRLEHLDLHEVSWYLASSDSGFTLHLDSSSDSGCLLTKLTALRSTRLRIDGRLRSCENAPLPIESLVAALPAFGFDTGDLNALHHLSLPKLRELSIEEFRIDRNIGYLTLANQLTSLKISGGIIGTQGILPADISLPLLRSLSLTSLALPMLTHPGWDMLQPLCELQRLKLDYIFNAKALLDCLARHSLQLTELQVACTAPYTADVKESVRLFKSLRSLSLLLKTATWTREHNIDRKISLLCPNLSCYLISLYCAATYGPMEEPQAPFRSNQPDPLLVVCCY